MTVASLSTPVILILFVAAGALIWWAGGVLAATTDAIDAHFGWGEGLGGAVFLAIATNLPEVAIIAGGAFSGSLGVAVGNILGGIAIQTVVLVLLDGPGLRIDKPLSSLVPSLTIALEGLVLIAILMLCIIGALSPRDLIFARTTPAEIAILLVGSGACFSSSATRTTQAGAPRAKRSPRRPPLSRRTAARSRRCSRCSARPRS